MNWIKEKFAWLKQPVKGEDSGTFTTFRGTDGKWYWNLKAKNGEIVSTSEAYTRRVDAKRGAHACQDAAWNAMFKDA